MDGMYQNQIYAVIGRIGGNCIRARGTARMVAAVAGNIVKEWSGTSRIKQKLSSPVQWVLARIEGANGKSGSTPETIPADAARLVTLLAASFNAAHAGSISGQGEDSGASIRAFLENLDFGEIMEMVEGSEPYVLKAVQAFNAELWKYPAKVGTMVATLIPLINILIKASREVLVPIEKAIGPDLLADIVLSLVKGVNGVDTARLITTFQEVLRRIHTGSLLLGKGGKPLMQIYLTDVLKACLPQMNPELTKKARIILAEDKLSIAQAVADALHDNPDITLAYLASMGSVKTSAVKARARKLRVYEDLGQNEFQAALSESLSDLDTYEIADLINSACRILNRIHALKPNFLLSLASGVADSLDQQAIAETAQWLVTDLVQAFKPLAPAVMPAFIKGMCELLSPEGGYESAAQAEAMQTLRATLAQAGGEK